ncbi:hypothetical protein BH11VER1_BH11VER1_40580 [soil metagenome]
MSNDIEITYSAEHAARALEIVRDCLPFVRPHRLYDRLVAVLETAERWREAHDVFDDIRVQITLPAERAYTPNAPVTPDHAFIFIAELAAKTAYNCSGPIGPFDDDSYDALIAQSEFFRKEFGDTPPSLRRSRRWWQIWRQP